MNEGCVLRAAHLTPDGETCYNVESDGFDGEVIMKERLIQVVPVARSLQMLLCLYSPRECSA